jgi:hypothetical protein
VGPGFELRVSRLLWYFFYIRRRKLTGTFAIMYLALAFIVFREGDSIPHHCEFSSSLSEGTFWAHKCLSIF